MPAGENRTTGSGRGEAPGARSGGHPGLPSTPPRGTNVPVVQHLLMGQLGPRAMKRQDQAHAAGRWVRVPAWSVNGQSHSEDTHLTAGWEGGGRGCTASSHFTRKDCSNLVPQKGWSQFSYCPCFAGGSERLQIYVRPHSSEETYSRVGVSVLPALLLPPTHTHGSASLYLQQPEDARSPKCGSSRQSQHSITGKCLSQPSLGPFEKNK